MSDRPHLELWVMGLWPNTVVGKPDPQSNVRTLCNIIDAITSRAYKVVRAVVGRVAERRARPEFRVG